MSYQFGASDLMSALGLVAAEWEIQDNGSNRQQDWAGTKTKDGAHVAAAETAHNDRSEITLNLKSANPAGASAVFSLGGAGTTGVVVTQFSAKETFNDNATLSLTAHKHETIETDAVHLATPVDEEISLSLGFGIAAARLGGTLKDCQSSELSGSVEHTDRFSNTGKFLTGASHGLKYECTEEYVDSGSAITVEAPWNQDSQDLKTKNEDFYTRSVKAHAYSLA
jgi:hypothetical protein